MNKRTFIKIGFVSFAGVISSRGFANSGIVKKNKKFVLPVLDYRFEELEPYLSHENLTNHYNKYHIRYSERLNELLTSCRINPQSAREILQNASTINHEIVNACGAFLNHRIYLNGLSARNNTYPVGLLKSKIELNFGSFDRFKSEFEKTALSLKNNGWCWLIRQDEKLVITTTSANGNPFMDTLPSEKRGVPVMTIDMWKHAYIRDYENPSDYINAFWKIIDWNKLDIKYRNQLSLI